MNFFTRLTRTATRVIRDLVEAPAVHRQLADLRATDLHREGQSKPAPRTVEVEVDPNTVPTTEEIEAAARKYEAAKAERNAADRLRRQADRVLRRTPSGTHGAVTVERVESSRQTVDVDAVKALFAAHNLGPVPMKVCAPSITLTFAAENTTEDTAPVLVAA